MFQICILVILFYLSSSFSMMLMGDRTLIFGNILNFQSLIKIIFLWKFILAMFLAVLSRIFHILTNSAMLKIPSLAQNATTISTFVMLVSFIFVVVVNYIFLGKVLNFKQWMGALVIVFGVYIILT